MANILLSTTIKKLEAEVRTLLRAYDLRKLPSKERTVLTNLMQNFEDARIYANAFEASEKPEDRRKNASQSRKWLEQARKNILSASEFNVFGAVDVASLSAQIEQALQSLK